MNGVVFKQMSQTFGVGQIVNCYDFRYVFIGFLTLIKILGRSINSTETINRDFCHNRYSNALSCPEIIFKTNHMTI